MLEKNLIELLDIVIGCALAIASAYGTLFVAKATQRAKLEMAK